MEVASTSEVDTVSCGDGCSQDVTSRCGDVAAIPMPCPLADAISFDCM